MDGRGVSPQVKRLCSTTQQRPGWWGLSPSLCQRAGTEMASYHSSSPSSEAWPSAIRSSAENVTASAMFHLISPDVLLRRPWPSLISSLLWKSQCLDSIISKYGSILSSFSFSCCFRCWGSGSHSLLLLSCPDLVSPRVRKGLRDHVVRDHVV